MAASTLDRRPRPDALHASPVVVPGTMIRALGALLALAVAAAHVADQGGIRLFTSPDWLGWSYRLIEVGGVLTALALLLPITARLGWAAGVLLGAGPLIGYVLSRTVGLPSDGDDVGNWGDWVGTISLLVEAALVAVSVSMLRARAAYSARPSTRIDDDMTLAEASTLWLPAGWK
jgi:hypothetical protein